MKVKYNYLKDKPSSSGQGLVLMIRSGNLGKTKQNQKNVNIYKHNAQLELLRK